MFMSFTDCIGTVPHKSVISYETPGQSADSYSSRWIFALAFFVGG